MKIDQTVKRIADAQIRSVIDISNATGSQSGVIKVNHNTYNVSVGTDGKVDVSFRGGWFNFLRKNSLDRMRKAMQTQYTQFKRDYDATVSRPDVYDSFEDQFSPAVKTARNGTDAVITNRFGADAEHQEVVLYGFGDVREMVADKLEQRNVNFTSIDYYNNQFGIDPKTLSFDTLPGILDGIKNGTLKIVDGTDNIVPREKLERWGRFLHDHAGKIDIFAKIRQYKTAAENPRAFKRETGWVGEAARKGIDRMMESLIRKNIPGDTLRIAGEYMLADKDITALSYFFQELAARDGKASKDELKALIMEGLGYAGYESTSPEFVEDLLSIATKVMRNMVFRQTSKLGLEFFKQEGTPVMFQWSNHEGVSLENCEKTITNTWWKNERDSVHNHYGATITFSEMRHVMKMQAAPDGNPPDILKVYGMRV